MDSHDMGTNSKSRRGGEGMHGEALRLVVAGREGVEGSEQCRGRDAVSGEGGPRRRKGSDLLGRRLERRHESILAVRGGP